MMRRALPGLVLVPAFAFIAAGLPAFAALAAGDPVPAPAAGDWHRGCGTCAVAGNRTLDQARACAYREATLDALQAAGVEKRVSSRSVLTYTQQGPEDARQQFLEVSDVAFQGGVTAERGTEVTTEVDAAGQVVVRHCADFQVRLYETVPDPAFQPRVEGLQPAYPSPASLGFTVHGPAGCLQAFLLEGDRVQRFYPSQAEPHSCFPSFDGTGFPLPERQHAYVLTDDPFPPGEGGDGVRQLVFLFTRSDFSRSVPPDWEARPFLQWVQSLEPADRHLYLHPFVFLP